MYSFLNPVLLWGLLAIFIPILIHLFSRQRVKKIDFSSLIFLKSLEKTRLRAIKIKELLLLLIRSLLIFCVVLAFARPTSHQRFASKLGANTKSSILFMIDNSYAMGYETKTGNLLRLAQKECEELLKIYREGDELYLVTYNSEPERFLSHPTFDSSLISRAIQEVELSFEPSDLDKALISGLDLLSKSKNENKEIYLLTDLKSSQLSPLKRKSATLREKGIKLFIVGLTEEEKENWGLKKVELPGGFITKEIPFEIKGLVKNYSRGGIQNLLLSLYLDGKRVSQADVDLKAGEEKGISFMQPVKETGFHSGYLEISDDNLLADNKRFFTFRIPEKIELLLVEGKSDKENFLRFALNPKGESESGIEITQISPKSFSRKDLSTYKVIILSDFKGITSENLSRLDDFLDSGKGVFLFFGQGEKELYAEICQRYLSSAFRGGKDFSGNGPGFLTLEGLDLFHPIFLPYKGLDKAKFPQTRFFYVYEMIPGKDIRVLASFSQGTPALVEAFSEQGRVLAFLSSYDPKFSDLGEHTLLVPLVRRSIEYLSSDLFTSDEYRVGQNIRKELELKKAERIELLDPENLKIILSPEFMGERLVFKLGGLKKPGIYKLKSEDKLLDQFAVNLDTRDSDAEPLSGAELTRELKGIENIMFIQPEQNSAEEVSKTRYGKELSKNFLWFALGLLILEMIISKSRKKDLKYFLDSSGEKSAQKV